MQPPADEILLEGLRFYAYHGVNPEERALGQRFLVDSGSWRLIRAEVDGTTCKMFLDGLPHRQESLPRPCRTVALIAKGSAELSGFALTCL